MERYSWLALAVYLVFLQLAYAAPEVRVGKTTFVGAEFPALSQDFFGGIPFAEPPVGSHRLRPATLKARLSVPKFKAETFGPDCLQAGGFGPPPVGAITAEDCLTVNIFRPSGLPHRAKLPVLFWAYGGAYSAGAGSLYNASSLISQSVKRGTPIIYVNFNYRLGVLGWPTGSEAQKKGSLNLGLTDYLTALEWVHKNIEFFGGDKNKVTVFGESAGAMATSILLLNSPIAKFVRGAILESGSANPATGTAIGPAQEASWSSFVSGVVSCKELAGTADTFACLQSANTTEITTAFTNSVGFFQPVVDEPKGLYPDFPSKLLSKGKFVKIPFIAGTNLDEGTAFSFGQSFTEAELRASLLGGFNPSFDNATREAAADTMLKLYPNVPALGSPYRTGNETFGQPDGFKRSASITGDTMFTSHRRFQNQAASRFEVKNYGYIFSQPQTQGVPFWGVNHGAEIAYVYGNPPDDSESSKRLTLAMMDYWISFTVSLDPNDKHGSRRPIWPQYTTKNQVVMELNGDDLSPVPDTFRQEGLGYINSNALLFNH